MGKGNVFTLDDLKNSAAAKRNPQLFQPKEQPQKKQTVKAPTKRSQEKEWLQAELLKLCEEHGLQLLTEHRFDEYRKWRFDWAIASIKVAVEYEGIFSTKSRHTTLEGYTGDAIKYNHAVLKGWRIFRCTAMNYQDVPELVQKIITDKK